MRLKHSKVSNYQQSVMNNANLCLVFAEIMFRDTEGKISKSQQNNTYMVKTDECKRPAL